MAAFILLIILLVATLSCIVTAVLSFFLMRRGLFSFWKNCLPSYVIGYTALYLNGVDRFKDLTNVTIGETNYAVKGIVTLEGYVFLIKETLVVSMIWLLTAVLVWTIYVWPRKYRDTGTTRNEEKIGRSS